VTGPQPWNLQDCLPRFDAWVNQEQPLDDLPVYVLDWIFTHSRDSYADARPVPGFADYWQAVIPRSEHFDDNAERCAVVCLFWLDASARSVRCDRVASLSLCPSGRPCRPDA